MSASCRHSANSIAALAGGDAGISEDSNSPGLGTLLGIAKWFPTSSMQNNLVDILKPMEGIEPSVPGIPSPGCGGHGVSATYAVKYYPHPIVDTACPPRHYIRYGS